MKINTSAYLLIGLLILSSCGTAKKAHLKEVENLRFENDKLKLEIKRLKNTIDNINIVEKEVPVHNITPILTLDPKNEVVVVKSQLSDLEQIINKDAALYSKFLKFKEGGIEKYINVSSSDMENITTEAKTYIGTKHVMGRLSHSGIDCSGLLHVSFLKNGIKRTPRTAQDFARLGSVVVSTNELQKGDLVFFTNTYRSSKLVTHAGIYLGNGDFIHTSSSKGVMISKINDPYYWRKKFLFGTRVIN